MNKLSGGAVGATGYIEFVIIGSTESKSKALLGGFRDIAKNENAIMFSLEQEESFAQIRDFIENKIRERYTTQPTQPTQVGTPDVATQINSLKQLFDSGVLSED